MKSFRIAFQSGQNLDEVYAKFCMDAYGSTGAPFRTQDDLADILSSAKLSLEDARRVTVSEAWAFAETEKTDVEVDGEDWQICVSNVGPSKTVDHAGAVDAHVQVGPYEGDVTLLPREWDGALDSWGSMHHWITPSLHILDYDTLRLIVAEVRAAAPVKILHL